MRLLSVDKPVVVAGDLNVARGELDVYDPPNSTAYPGFTPAERRSFATRLLDGCGLTDAFRERHLTARGYTWFGQYPPTRQGISQAQARRENKGWRLDYWLLPTELKARAHDVYVLKDVEGSDHVPLGIVLRKK